jgi:putative nucleotidyltransferase with HDIG domain
MPISDDWDRVAVTVVDDEPCMRDVLVRAAKSWQYPCQSAGSAEQALQLLQERPTPVVVTDLRMPGNGGIWLVREIQRRWPDTGIIVITAGEDSAAAMECLNAGADRYFLKPIDLDEFRDALESTLRDYQLERDRERYRRDLEHEVKRQMRQVRRTYLSAIDSLVRTLEARHPCTKGHSIRVSHYCQRLAASLSLDSRLTKKLILAAKLHDIGKVGTPEAILNKPGRLTKEEYAIICEHTITGERILSPIIRSRTILAAIRGHHERIDGKGYPDRLKGDRIPLLARIIAIADCYDALTSSRAYRLPLSPRQAFDVLREGAGTQFQADLVHAFLALEGQSLCASRRPQ